ncbi:uncharacterized protein BX664DRAFT_339365 [Halteromyces radiatus]|uniref:uncharacterized protein n=1 Tax=Halteromyces radiatus TaxID=101107 RepID=UPI00221E6802|nr:uncharacterized protein BX664DRAFT_339365 [Halteromyces radiatus]KAI8082897.1 hypothetical protein BX664DRAFT_339365 [Halteromyces radiatus]
MTSTTTGSIQHHHHQQQQRFIKKMEVAPSDLLLDDTDVFGLNDTSLLLDDQQLQHRITSVYATDLPTPPANIDSPSSDYLGIKRRHSSICSDSSDDASSVQSDSEKRPCLVHSPCSLPESPPQLPMFDFDDEDEDEDNDIMDKRTRSTTDFQPYPTIMEWMTDDEDDMTLHQQQQLDLELTITNEPSIPKPSKKAKTTNMSKKQHKEKSTKSTKSTTKKSSPPSSPSSSSTDLTDDTSLPVYVPHGAAQVELRYSTQGLYKHLLKQRVDWCRYCGTTEGVNWRPGPWGKRTLCNKHGCDYKGYGFACKLPRLDLTAFVKEPMDQRIRPVLQLFCSCCHRSESWEDNLLVQCDGCPMAYHQQCRREQDLDDEFCASSQPFFCTGDKCRDNLKKKRVVVEFSRKRLPLMRTPKQQQAMMDALKQ